MNNYQISEGFCLDKMSRVFPELKRVNNTPGKTT